MVTITHAEIFPCINPFNIEWLFSTEDKNSIYNSQENKLSMYTPKTNKKLSCNITIRHCPSSLYKLKSFKNRLSTVISVMHKKYEKSWQNLYFLSCSSYAEFHKCILCVIYQRLSLVFSWIASQLYPWWSSASYLWMTLQLHQPSIHCKILWGLAEMITFSSVLHSIVRQQPKLNLI